MALALVTHEACLGHDPGPGHPERVERLRAVLASLGEAAFADLIREQAPRASAGHLSLVHDPAFVKALLAVEVSEGQHRALDPDTILSEGSIEAALRAAGGAIHAVDLVMSGRAHAAFAPSARPATTPNRRAPWASACSTTSPSRARARPDALGLSSASPIADLDVHHGNGTQAAF